MSPFDVKQGETGRSDSDDDPRPPGRHERAGWPDGRQAGEPTNAPQRLRAWEETLADLYTHTHTDRVFPCRIDAGTVTLAEIARQVAGTFFGHRAGMLSQRA